LPASRLYLGDCLEVMRGLESGSVDAVVTDPPAGISFMGKGWDTFDAFPKRERGDLPGGKQPQQTPHKHGHGFARGITWNSSSRARDQFIAFLAERLAEARRVARPGGHLLCWALPRTSHWTALAIEEAGWTIRDRISHLFGTGFPKSKSCLKPACEDWWLAKAPGPLLPLEIDAARIAAPNGLAGGGNPGGHRNPCYMAADDDPRNERSIEHPAGRWPANVCLSHHDDCRPAGTRRVRGSHSVGTPRDGLDPGIFGNGTSHKPFDYTDPDGLETIDAYECVEGCPARALGEMSGESRSTGGKTGRVGCGGRYNTGWNGLNVGENAGGLADTGTAARFYYTSKSSRRDRNAGLDDTETVSVELIHSPVTQEDESWASLGRKVVLLVDTAQSPPRVIAGFMTPGPEADVWSRFLFGSGNEGQSPQGCRCITGTETSSTTASKTLNWLTRSPTSEYTADARCGTACGSSHAGSVARPARSITITSARSACLPGVGRVASQTRLRISFVGAANHHATVKSTDLMRWLCRLVTPTGGIILDPFAGSGSTGKACAVEGFGFVGIEQDPEYYVVAEARIAGARADLPLFEGTA
jgi:hypothetical protein